MATAPELLAETGPHQGDGQLRAAGARVEDDEPIQHTSAPLIRGVPDTWVLPVACRTPLSPDQAPPYIVPSTLPVQLYQNHL